MNDSNSYWRAALTATILTALLALPLAAQPTFREYEPFQRTPEYDSAMEQVLGKRGSMQQGVADLLRIARANPGRTVGAHAYFSAACYCESRQQQVEIYEEVRRVFPNSEFDLAATSILIKVQSKTKNDYFQSATQVLNRFGAPTVGDISQRPLQALARVRALPVAVRDGLRYVYLDLTEELGDPKVARYSEAVALSTFGQVVYTDESSVIAFTNRAHQLYVELKVGRFQPVNNLPRLKVRSPLRQCGQRPVIRLEVTLRDGHSVPLAPQNWRFFLDGQEVSSQVQLVNWRFNPTAKKNQIFQQYLAEYRAAKPLTPGTHIFKGILTGGTRLPDPQSLNFEVPIRVKQGEREDDDDRDREHWNESD